MTESSADPPRYHQLANKLREQIHQGQYPPGTALPAEAEICRRLGIGIMTVRRALAILREEGLITTRRGTLSTVRPATERRRVALGDDDLLRSRMPSHPERITLGLDPGVPLLEVKHANGTVELFVADQVEFGRSSTPHWERRH